MILTDAQPVVTLNQGLQRQTHFLMEEQANPFMYLEHFGLAEFPFNLTPDPRFFYASSSHQEAFVGLCNGIKLRQGAILVTGEVGTGKTTLLSEVQAQCDPRVHAVIISNPPDDVPALLKAIALNLGIASDRMEPSSLLDQLNAYLTQQAHEDCFMAVLIDDAHQLGEATLQTILSLTELQSDKKKLLQIVLAGRPELKKKLSAAALRPIAGLVTLEYELDPLSKPDVARYIRHRLARAGYEGKPVFTAEAIEAIARDSRGIPGSINVLCDNALMAAYAGSKSVSAQTVDEVARELQLGEESEPVLRAASNGGHKGSFRTGLLGKVSRVPDHRFQESSANVEAGADPVPQDSAANRWQKLWFVLLAVAVAGFIAIFYFSKRDLNRESLARPGSAREAGTAKKLLDRGTESLQEPETSASLEASQSSISTQRPGTDVTSAGAQVFVHISRERDRAIARGITNALRENGYRVPEIRSVAGPTQGDVRFFFPADRRDAQRVKAVVEKQLARRGRRTSLGLLERDGRKFQFASPGKIELWLPPLMDTDPERRAFTTHPYSPQDSALERFGAD